MPAARGQHSTKEIKHRKGGGISHGHWYDTHDSIHGDSESPPRPWGLHLHGLHMCFISHQATHLVLAEGLKTVFQGFSLREPLLVIYLVCGMMVTECYIFDHIVSRLNRSHRGCHYTYLEYPTTFWWCRLFQIFSALCGTMRVKAPAWIGSGLSLGCGACIKTIIITCTALKLSCPLFMQGLQICHIQSVIKCDVGSPTYDNTTQITFRALAAALYALYAFQY